MFRKINFWHHYKKRVKGPEMIKRPLNYSKNEDKYSIMLKTVVEHLRDQGYDLKVNNGKKKLRPRMLKGFLPDVHALNGSDEIVVEISTDNSDIRKWRRFAYTDGIRFWIVAPYPIADSVKTCVETFSIPAEVYACNGTMELKRVL